MLGLQRVGDIKCQVTIYRAEEKQAMVVFLRHSMGLTGHGTLRKDRGNTEEQTQAWEPETVSSPDRMTLE